MFTLITREVFEPLFRRVGTAAASGLVAYGVAEGPANAVGLGIVALLGIGIDLASSHMARRVREGQ